MTTESQSQLLKPSDRNEYRVEKVQDLLNKSPTPDTFEGFVYTNHSTEESATTGPIFCRVFSPSFHDAGSTNPIDAKSRQEYNSAIQACKQGSIRSDHPNAESLTNGSIWICKKEGALVTLISLKQGSSFSFDDASGGITGKAGGAMNAMSSGKKIPLGNRAANTAIQVVYAADANMRAQVAKFPHYKVFLDAFIDKLAQTAFSQTSIKVNSMFRTPTDQARAMARTRFFGNQKTYNSFYSWFNTTYGTTKLKVQQIRTVIEANKSSTQAQMEAAIKARLDLQVKAGVYLSGHMQNGAFDLHTSSLPFQDVILMLEVLETMKSAHVSYLNWEGVWDYKANSNAPKDKDLGLRTRKTRGPINNEHIHLNVIKTGAPAE